MTLPHDDELMAFAPEPIGKGDGADDTSDKTWRILLVDDDCEVHQATLLALKNEVIEGRPLEFLHAYSSAEAREVLVAKQGIAVILLDVVMDSPDAGLRLVRVIREELGMAEVRIILRTGQPGYAPEMRVIRDYDINDYKSKAELTYTRLVTTLITAIRSFEQLRVINISRLGLGMIVRSAAELFAHRALGDFAEGVLTQIAAMLGLAPEGLICAHIANHADGVVIPENKLVVVGAAGRYRDQISQPLDGMVDKRIVETINLCVAQQKNIYGPNETVLFVRNASGQAAAVFLDSNRVLSSTDRQLLEVFCVNIAVGFENVELFRDLSFFAYNDPLCRLPNRTRLVEIIDQQLQEGCRDTVLCAADIDHFSSINDALGHRNGDLLLRAVAERLRQNLGSDVVLARVAGDSFAMLGEARLIDPVSIIALFDQPFQIEEHSLSVRVTIGQAMISEVDGGGIDVLKCANIALNRAKLDQRGSYYTYTRAMASETRERLTLLHDLRAAMKAEVLQVFYQPKVELASGRIVGAEALLRWKYHNGTFISPDVIVSLAEYSGLIFDLGEWVMRSACRQARTWLNEGHTDFCIAINVSMNQFRSPDFIGSVQACIDDIGIPPSAIELEITETIAMLEVDVVIDALQALKKIGVKIAIDDFGTGFSSLSYLHRLPIDTLKIDRAFIKDLSPETAGTSDSQSGPTIAEMILNLGEGLGLALVAEGVETEFHVSYLRALGCDYAQGYYYAKPLDAHAFAVWRDDYLARLPRA
jgi:diguanylate cyclase (GGDEF)-like protein